MVLLTFHACEMSCLCEVSVLVLLKSFTFRPPLQYIFPSHSSMVSTWTCRVLCDTLSLISYPVNALYQVTVIPIFCNSVLFTPLLYFPVRLLSSGFGLSHDSSLCKNSTGDQSVRRRQLPHSDSQLPPESHRYRKLRLPAPSRILRVE